MFKTSDVVNLGSVAVDIFLYYGKFDFEGLYEGKVHETVLQMILRNKKFYQNILKIVSK